MDLKPGSRWKSAVCDTQVVVVRPPKSATTLECGGHEMVPHAGEAPAGLAISPDLSGGTTMGKRYADPETGAEILCTKAGAGSLSIGGRPIDAQDAKKLPASD